MGKPTDESTAPGMRLLVYDTDGVNPYGRELAAMLAGAGADVLVLVPADAEWRPAGCTVRPVLPGNRGGASKVRQVLALITGVLHSARSALIGRRTCIVAFDRSALEDLCFVAIAMVRSVGVVAHEAVPRGSPSWLRQQSSRLLLRRATWVIAHSTAAAQEVEAMSGRKVEVCGFHPHTAWWEDHRPAAARPTASGRLLVLGQLRPDKGIDALPRILTMVDPEIRDRLTITICGKGPVDADLLHDLASVVAVDDRSANTFVPDHEVAEVLAKSDLLLAPYPGASQSSTIAVALAAGLGVLAYDAGSIGEIVDETGVVPVGDEAELASRIAVAVVDGRMGRARHPDSAWRALCQKQWSSLLRQPTPRFRKT